ncbi:prepilin peptidase [Halonatronum saccharophilum]|uniref:prepilin peptidase n=1 Tax=Halonatronum saccharophilum TaxID=150060 RepID=UPI0004828043|nr:A24 family peptidase [Halonatronum saccharophilum]
MELGLVIFIFGSIVGSFLNVVIYRLPAGKSIVFPPSECGNCGHRLGFLDLIPIISYLLQKGRCRHCGTKFSIQYPLVEFLTGLLFLALYWKFNLGIEFYLYLVLASLLISATFIDFKHQIIPNKLTYSGIIFGISSSLYFDHIGFRWALLGFLIGGGFLLLVAIASRGGMGVGDVKFAALIGTFIGPTQTFVGIILGALIGSVVGIALIVTKQIGGKDRIPFGPLIALGTLLMIFFGDSIIDLYWSIVL